MPVVPGETPADQTDEGVARAIKRVGLPGARSRRRRAAAAKACGRCASAGEIAEAMRRTPRSARGVRRRHALCRAADRASASRRSPGLRRRARASRAPVRARVLHAAPPQKVIEESPAPAIARGACATQMGAGGGPRGARPSDYRNAGHHRVPVEGDGDRGVVLLPRDEHAPPGRARGDRAVTGVDLVRAQLLVAAGERAAVASDTTSANAATRSKAASTRRIPTSGFLPQAGRVLLYREPPAPGVRIDSGVAEGDRGLGALRSAAGEGDR